MKWTMPPRGFDTPYAMEPGDTFQGTLDSGAIGGETNIDADVVRIDLVAGTTYEIHLTGRGTNPVGDPALRLYDSNEVVVALNDNLSFPDDLDSFIEFTPSISGNYLLYVTGLDTGDYELLVSEGDPSPDPGITRSGGHDNDIFGC